MRITSAPVVSPTVSPIVSPIVSASLTAALASSDAPSAARERDAPPGSTKGRVARAALVSGIIGAGVALAGVLALWPFAQDDWAFGILRGALFIAPPIAFGVAAALGAAVSYARRAG